MRHFPAFLDLQGREALLLGRGEAVEAKAALLEAAGARLRRIARFEGAHQLEGCAIAVAAGAPEADLEALFAAAQARGLPVNVVDRPAMCSFITPAIIDRAPVTVAVSTGGAAPVLARLIRQRIETVLPPGLARLARLAGRLQGAVRARLPETAARRRFLEGVLAGPVAELAVSGREAEAEAAFGAALAEADRAPPGLVHLVEPGPGAPDLLTLRALRVMGEADVLLHTPEIPAAILDLARRDAERAAVPAGAAGALLLAEAERGRRVVRLSPRADAAEAEACRAAGIVVERVPGLA